MRIPRIIVPALLAGTILTACEDQPTQIVVPDESAAISPTSHLYDGPPLDFSTGNGPLRASALGQPVPASVIVSSNGLEWVWASPCTPTGCTAGIDVGHDGFQFATDAQWAVRPAVSDFLNVDGSLKCASPWFDHTWDHCDYGDGVAGFYGSSHNWWEGPNGGQRDPNAETWLVRVTDPQTKDDCKNGGWEQYGFRNQGQCVRFVETGKDSR